MATLTQFLSVLLSIVAEMPYSQNLDKIIFYPTYSSLALENNQAEKVLSIIISSNTRLNHHVIPLKSECSFKLWHSIYENNVNVYFKF